MTMHAAKEPGSAVVAYLDLCERCHLVYWRGADDR